MQKTSQLTLSADSAAAQNCIRALWDKGRLFSDISTRKEFEANWKLTVLTSEVYPLSGAFVFDTEEDLTYFILRWL